MLIRLASELIRVSRVANLVLEDDIQIRPRRTRSQLFLCLAFPVSPVDRLIAALKRPVTPRTRGNVQEAVDLERNPASGCRQIVIFHYPLCKAAVIKRFETWTNVRAGSSSTATPRPTQTF
jgi:hypothetical protein